MADHLRLPLSDEELIPDPVRDALAAQVRTQLQAIRRAEFQLGESLAELQNLGGGMLFGAVSLAVWLQEFGQLGESAAAGIVSRAVALNSRREGSGARPPLAPQTASAAAEGRLSDENIDIIVDLLEKLLDPGDHPGAEAHLVDYAQTAEPPQVRKAANRIAAYLGPEDPEPDDKDPLPEPQRTCKLHKKRKGGWKLEADVDDASGAVMNTILDGLSKPRTGEDTPDDRSASERRGDALVEVFDLAADTDGIPTRAGERVHVTVTIPFDSLKSEMGKACLDLTTEISAAEARIWACDCTLIPAVLGTEGEVLDLGRAKRLIAPAQRKALYLRDGGCAWPGCDAPPRRCSGHHCVPWEHDGPTDLCNLVLLCPFHHRKLHRAGWTVRIAPDGLPEFIPPEWLDPQRKPRRNTMHHPLRL